MLNSASRSGFLNRWFKLEARGTTTKREIIAGITTFLSMVYSVIVIPSMLSTAGFPANLVFVSTCLIAAFGSLLLGLWANLPLAIGCAISLGAFTAYNLGIGTTLTINEALGAIFFMGVIFTLITLTGLRKWILRNIPMSIAQGTGIGIGLFLLIIAATNSQVGLIVRNTSSDLPVAFGDFTSFPVICTLVGLVAIIALEKRKIPGAILWVIITLSLIGLVFDPAVSYHGFFTLLPTLHNAQGHSLFLALDFSVITNMAIVPIILALVITAIFDATGTIRAVAGQANLIDKKGQIIAGSKALTADSVSSIIAGLIGTSPAAVYIESATGTAAGGRTGLTAVVVGLLFVVTLFLAPLANLVPAYATAPALMYVGLLMLSNVSNIDFKDKIGSLSGLICAVFIALSCNIVTGIMLGFASLVLGRLIAGEWRKLNLGIVVIAVILVIFYATGWAHIT